MMKGIKICSWIKGFIFAYFSKMSAYPDSLDMNELAEIPYTTFGIFKNEENMLGGNNGK